MMPFQVGLFLAPLAIAQTIKTMIPIIRSISTNPNVPMTITLIEIVVHPAVEQGFSLLDRLGNQFFLIFD